MLLSEILASLQPADSGLSAAVSDDWSQGRATFGGLIAAIGNAAMRTMVPAERPLRSLQTTFVGPASHGTWQIKVRVLRMGKTVTLAACDILDRNEIVATQVGVYGTGRASAVCLRPATVGAPRQIDELRDMRYRPGVTPEFIQHFAIRWSEGNRLFSGSGNAPTKAFIRHRDPAPLSESAIIALIDCIPTPALSMLTTPAHGSSLVWTLEFFEHNFDFSPQAYWRIDTNLDAACDGYVNQTGVLNDPDGRPVALSRQLFAIFG
jgi:acyl-CoA thioesterase